MPGSYLFQIGEEVVVPTPRSALFRKRPASLDRVTGTIVGREATRQRRTPSTSDADDTEWLYFVKVGWNEPWIEISQIDLLRLNPRHRDNPSAAD